MPADLTGQLLGPFYVERRLGSGAMGTVYRAIHKKNGKTAAIKVMSTPGETPNPTLAARFEREIQLLSQFRHPHIVRIFGSSNENGVRFYAMELVDGRSLQEILDEKGKLSFQRAAAYAMQICEALQEIHKIGVIHRDLKPANVMVSGDHQLKLTDFGIAKDLTASHSTQLTQADTTVGTVAYMSPEQLAGKELTRRSDIYSLGIVLYRMITGRLPFLGDTMFDYMNARMEDKFPLPSQLDPSLPLEADQLIRQMMAKEPEDRPRDAYVVLQKLLDIGKRAKEGTLAKTKPKTAEHAAETVDSRRGKMSTVIRTMTGVFSRKSAGKKVVIEVDKPPFYESAPFLAACLFGLIALAAYLLRPLGEDQLFERGSALAASGNRIDMEIAKAKYFDPLLKKYPNTRHKQAIAEIDDKIAMEICRGKANQAKLGVVRDSASEAERKYIQAQLIGERLGDKARAEEMFRAIVEWCKDKPGERGWLLLAQKRLEDPVKYETDEARTADRRKAIENGIAQSKQLLSEDKLLEAVAILDSLRTLYRDDAEVRDLIEQVEELRRGRR